jgi:hypothetical protein
MSYSKLNRVGLAATAAMLLAIGVIQGCSSSDDSQAQPTAGTSSGGKSGSGTGGGASGGKGGTTSTGGTTSSGAAGVPTMSEGGEAGATGGGVCEAAEDHGEAAYLAAHGGKLPTL